HGAPTSLSAVRRLPSLLFNPLATARGSVTSRILLHWMRRAHASRRLRATRIIDDDTVLSTIHRQAIAVGRPLLCIFDMRGVAFQDHRFVRSRVLTPIARATLARLNHDDIALRDYSFQFVYVLLQIDVRRGRG